MPVSFTMSQQLAKFTASIPTGRFNCPISPVKKRIEGGRYSSEEEKKGEGEERGSICGWAVARQLSPSF